MVNAFMTAMTVFAHKLITPILLCNFIAQNHAPLFKILYYERHIIKTALKHGVWTAHVSIANLFFWIFYKQPNQQLPEKTSSPLLLPCLSNKPLGLVFSPDILKILLCVLGLLLKPAKRLVP